MKYLGGASWEGICLFWAVSLEVHWSRTDSPINLASGSVYQGRACMEEQSHGEAGSEYRLSLTNPFRRLTFKEQIPSDLKTSRWPHPFLPMMRSSSHHNPSTININPLTVNIRLWGSNVCIIWGAKCC